MYCGVVLILLMKLCSNLVFLILLVSNLSAQKIAVLGSDSDSDPGTLNEADSLLIQVLNEAGFLDVVFIEDSDIAENEA